MKDAMIRFIDCFIPTEVCNLKCPYCYIGQRNGFTGSINPIGHSPLEVRAALSKKRFGGIMFINMCAGGETLLGADILPIVKELINEGHYVQIVTNGLLRDRFKEISTWDKEILQHLFIKFSFHYTELKRLNKIEYFFENILMVKNAGCSISLEVTPGDEMIPYIDEMKKISYEKLGALPHVTIARDNSTPKLKILSKLPREEYIKTWKSFDSSMFDLKLKLLGQKRCEYCYGGEWTFYLNLGTGDLRQCYKGDIIDNIYLDTSEPIHFKPIGTGCREEYCFNGHVWMTLGCIPNMDIISYADIRNRVGKDGTEWLQPNMKAFFSQKLQETNTVYENTESTSKIVLLGDSICQEYGSIVEKNLIDKADVYTTPDLARFSTYLLSYIQEWAKDIGIGSNINIVHFNVGLWDVLRIDGEEPLVSLSEYSNNLRKIIKRLQYVFPNAVIVFATTTPVLENEATYNFLRTNEDIKVYNSRAIEIMNENDVIINDLYSVANNECQYYHSDFTHFDNKGYEILAEAVSMKLIDIIENNNNAYGSLTAILNDDLVKKDMNILKKRRIIIYGAGKYGKKVIDKLLSEGIEVSAICDRNPLIQGSNYKNIPITAPEVYIEQQCDFVNDLIIVAIKDRNVVKNVLHLFKDYSDLIVCSLDVFDELEIETS